MSKIDVIISTLDQLTVGELKALRSEINMRLDDNPYNDGYRHGVNDANEQHHRDSMRHRQPVILEAQELSINLAVIATAAAVMNEGKDKVSDVMRDAHSQSVRLMDSLIMRINRAKGEGIALTLHADAWIEGLLHEAKDYYEQPLNNGNSIRAYVGQLDSSLKKIIDQRPDNRNYKIINRLCEKLDTYILIGEMSFAAAYRQVKKDMQDARQNRLHINVLTLKSPDQAEIELCEEIEYMLGEYGSKKKAPGWSEDSASKAYLKRFGSAKRLKKGNLP